MSRTKATYSPGEDPSLTRAGSLTNARVDWRGGASPKLPSSAADVAVFDWVICSLERMIIKQSPVPNKIELGPRRLPALGFFVVSE